MQLKLGAAIKKLRNERGVTQEELAAHLGVSFQAVSKWETDTTMPDIALLPKLAVFFGVRIDDLFSVDTDDELERIDFLLEHEKLTDDSFFYSKRVLDAILRENERDVGALKRYARLYLAKNSRDALAAGRLLEKAMVYAPLDRDIFHLYRNARGGDTESVRSGNDWFIRVCEPYARKYPENVRLLEQLVDAMIAMGHFDRAEEMIGLIRADDGYSACLPAIYRGDIACARGRIEEAVDLWKGVDVKNQKGQYEIGERFGRINQYDRAVACFENAFSAAVKPRDLSSVYSLALLHMKYGHLEKAMDAWRRILDALASDYGVTDGAAADWPKREMEKLRTAMAPI